MIRGRQWLNHLKEKNKTEMQRGSSLGKRPQKQKVIWMVNIYGGKTVQSLKMWHQRKKWKEGQKE